jgi:hypothetical protein
MEKFFCSDVLYLLRRWSITSGPPRIRILPILEHYYNMKSYVRIFSPLGRRHILFYLLKTFYISHAVYPKIFPWVGDCQ